MRSYVWYLLRRFGQFVLVVFVGINIVFFVTQVILFLLIPGMAGRGQWAIFELVLFVVFTMYGGGFATIPAFLADMFGAQNVGAIHGVLLTAWSAAAIVGPGNI